MKGDDQIRTWDVTSKNQLIHGSFWRWMTTTRRSILDHLEQ